MRAKLNRVLNLGLPALVATGIALSGCSPAQNEQNPVNEAVPGHDDPVTGVSAPANDPSALASLASDAASFQGDSAELVLKLNALDQAVQRAEPTMQANVRESLQGDLQSMRDAVDANDWVAAQEAASSIADKLDD